MTVEPERKTLSKEEIASLMAGIDPADLGREFDAEELDLIRTLRELTRVKGPARFQRHDPFARNRRFPRGDRRKNREGKKIGPVWRDGIVFKDEENKVVDLEATRLEQARLYLIRRAMPANRSSSFKKLSKAARILNG